MVGLLMNILVLIIVAALCLYVISNLVPDPMLNKVLRVVVVVVATLALVSLLMGGISWSGHMAVIR